MAEYKRLRGAKTLLALCFAECQETYHHWRVFSHGADGVCIEFDKQRLLSTFRGDRQVRSDYVKYKLIRELRNTKSIKLQTLPFLKRFPYQDERKFRVVYEDGEGAVEHRDYPIDIAWIRRVTLSPWMSKALADSVKASLRSIDGCARLKVSRSTLVDNDAWKEVIARIRA